MTNLKLSAKGRALLKKSASAKVAMALVREGERLAKNGSLTVVIAGEKTVRVRTAAPKR